LQVWHALVIAAAIVWLVKPPWRARVFTLLIIAAVGILDLWVR
jgi:hypothetical protein